MGKAPSFQFYPADWLRDPGVRACSLPARGLWFDMICYMHESPKYGYFLAGGQNPTDEEGARILGCTIAEYQACLAELERFSVFSRTKHGVVFCRRMIRDEAQRKAWRDRQTRHRTEKPETNQEHINVDSHAECHANVTPMSRLSSSSPSSSSANIKSTKYIAKSIKEPPSPGVKIFIDFYYQEFKKSFGTPPVIESGKDGALIKNLLKSTPLAELKDLLLKMFESDDKFIRGSGYTLGVFKSQINKLKIGNGKHKDGMDLWEAVHEEKERRDGIKGQDKVQITYEKNEGNFSGKPN